MSSTDFFLNGFDFEQRGYFGCPVDAAGTELPGEESEAWSVWLDVFREASKDGNFGHVGKLVPMQPQVHDPIWMDAACTLVGDAAPDGVCERILATAADYDAKRNVDFAIDLCRQLRGWGRLDVVPVILNVWTQLADIEDAMILPVFLSALLENEPGAMGDPGRFPSIAAYVQAVRDRLDDRANKFGTTNVFVLRGSRFGVNRIAEKIVQQVRDPAFSSDLRRSFEASTGIDCSDFYENGVLRAMPVKRKMLEYLDSAATEKFEDGKRYFFGHAIPG
jgi:hypothetical protein